MLDKRYESDVSCYMGCKEIVKNLKESMNKIEVCTAELCNNKYIEKIDKENVDVDYETHAISYAIRITDKGHEYIKNL